MTGSCKIFLLVVSLWAAGSAAVQAQPIRNEEVIAGLLIPKMLQRIEQFVPENQGLMVSPLQSDPISRWLSQILLDSCLQRNYFVYSAADSAGHAAALVKVGEGQSEVHYESAGKRLLFFSKGLRRQINARCRFMLLDETGRVLVSEVIAGEYSDLIAASEKEKVENPQYSFTVGTKKESPFINRWLEPVLITAATSTVIYLFYSLRSEK